MIKLTQDIVRELLDYDPESGLLRWKKRDLKWFSGGKHTPERRQKSWNSRCAGRIAFTSRCYGYCSGRIFNVTFNAHRIIWLWMKGEWPEFIDHVNGVRDDNRWENLRKVSRSENCMNTAMKRNNTSGYKGVHWHSSTQKWKAEIKDEYLGVYLTKEEAYEAYCKRAIELGFTSRHIFGEMK